MERSCGRKMEGRIGRDVRLGNLELVLTFVTVKYLNGIIFGKKGNILIYEACNTSSKFSALKESGYHFVRSNASLEPQVMLSFFTTRYKGLIKTRTHEAIYSKWNFGIEMLSVLPGVLLRFRRLRLYTSGQAFLSGGWSFKQL